MALCINAMYESTQDAKLRLACFIDKMGPIVTKSLSMAFLRWIINANDRVKEEFSNQFFIQKTLLSTKRKVFNSIFMYAVG